MPAPKPTPPPKTEITDIQTLLQCLLLGVPVADSRARSGDRSGMGWVGAPN